MIFVVTFATYADLYRLREVRRILVLGFFFRVPMSASGVLVTLHVVTHLHRSYTEAGVVSTVLALALALSSPWRGRVLDRIGLRRTLAPSLVVLATAWTVSPWVPYWPLVLLVGLAGLFMIPSFSIVRQVLLGAVSPAQRTPALSVDSMVTEISFMLGPVLGVLSATYLSTPVALLVVNCALVGAGFALWFADPPLRADDATEVVGDPRVRTTVPRRRWMTSGVVLLLVVTFTASLILVSEDLGSVAAMRSMHHSAALGLVMALWAFGSLVGALVYGALHRHPPAPVLLVLLGATTALVGVASGPLAFTILLVLSGLFCAPTLTATVDDLSRLVPASARGELMGWHGSAITLGSAAGAPAVGLAIDQGGWDAGLLLGGLLGLAIAVVVLVAGRSLRRPPEFSGACAGAILPAPAAPPAPDSSLA